jgi:hypothetical protein
LFLTDEEAAAIGAGTWRIDCVKVVATRNGPQRPRTLTGSGNVYVAPNGQLTMEVLFPRRSVDGWKLASELWTVAPGTVLPSWAEWTVRADDAKGRTWVARRVHLDFSRPASGGAFGRASLKEIVSVDKRAGATGLYANLKRIS